MKKSSITPKNAEPQLEALPNIGPKIAATLRAAGVLTPDDLKRREPLAVYQSLTDAKGQPCDPCVLYVLLAAEHFLTTGEARDWWKFTSAGKKILQNAGVR